jgi:hypothetical protein
MPRLYGEMMRRFAISCLYGVVLAGVLMAQHDAHQHGAASSQPALSQQVGQASAGLEESASAMDSHHLEMGAHMQMTGARPLRPGDQQRADEVLRGARVAAERYRDYHDALRDGFRIFLPEVPQKVYHFTSISNGFAAAFRLDPEKPTSLLYEKQGDGGYKLVGVMYTARKNARPEDLDQRIPLSIAQWHAHVNFCKAPKGREAEYFGPHAEFGLRGSIVTKEACDAAGGEFMPQVFGWMVHVYPFEKDARAVWSVERQKE